MIISRIVSTTNQLLTLKKLHSKAFGFSTTVFRCYLSHSVPKKNINMSRVKKRYDNIIKSSGDKREYRGLELDNGLKVVLISDPVADKSAAAIALQVGFMSDPDDLPGLTHFCEHMLFLGTKKYPEENEYTKYLTQHGGASNAYTATDYTCYYFDVAPEHLPGALDRFAQFFLEPLFTESATDREVNAVNSEHEKNLQTDSWRLNQLKMSCSKEGHPFGKFGTGNIMTLDILPKQKGVDVRQELLNFHEKWYSSNIMNLAVLGKESLDDLEEMVISMFSEIVNKNVPLPPILDHPFSAEQVGYKYYVTSIKDIRDLTILFPIPDLRNHYKSSPTSCISHVIGHEGPGSLLSALKARSWCNSLVIGTRSDHRGFEFIFVNVDLTETGIDNVNNIIHLLFQYITELKEEGPEKWKVIFDECKGLSNIHFRFKDKEQPRNCVTHIVSAMQIYPIEEVLSASYTLTDWKPELIEDLLKLLTPENIWVSVLAKKFKDISDEKEKWYGTEYKKEKISDELKKKWADGSKCCELHLPDKNDFIPTEFELLPREENPSINPSIIHQTQFCRVWYKQDDEFLLPKVNNSFEFISPLAYIDPLSCSMTYIFSMLFKDALNEFAYVAELAGLKWDLINTKYGMVLSIGGYNDKQKIFLEKIMEKMTNFKVDPKRFEIIKENYIRGLKNFSAEQPYQQAVYFLALLLSEHSWSKSELKDAADIMTLEKLEAFIPRLLSQLHVEALFHGNTTKQVCLDMMKTVMDRLDSSVAL